jgi:ATP adenylyltransferase
VAYVSGPKEPGCVFCQAVAAGEDRAHLVLHRETLAFIILNRYPYNSGHLMVVPVRHVARPGGLSGDEARALWDLVGLAIRVLEHAMAPEGFNVGMNLGRAAGAGIDDHLHVHVVPRWAGDTNYMPVLAETKVLPEHLDDTYQRLTEALDALRPAR